MTLCRYCGKKTSWFSNVHGACVHRANQAAETIATTVSKAVSTGRTFNDIRSSIEAIVSESHIPQRDALAAIKEGWSQGAEERSRAQPISDGEVAVILDFYRATGLTDGEIVGRTQGAYAVHFSNLIWRVLHDQTRPFEIDPPSGEVPTAGGSPMIGMFNPASFNLQAREVPVWGMANVHLKQENTTSSYVGSYGGPSIRVANGLWYRFGGMRGHREESTSLQDLDMGEVLITTRAIYFSGRARGTNFRLPFNQIIRFKPYADAVGICRNGAREQILAPQYVVWDDGGVTAANSGWFLFNILQALAARDSAAKVSPPQAPSEPVLQGDAALDALWQKIREERRKAGKDDLPPRRPGAHEDR